MEKSHEKSVILESGPEFFEDLEAEIASAQKYIFIKQFLWRNDEAGRAVATALHEAMERGVKVYIVKDRIGAFHEYGEGKGQSFFHDTPKEDPWTGTHSTRMTHLQAHMLAGFYGNGIEGQRPSHLRDGLISHPNCKVMDKYKLYDHSKLIIVDGEKAYIGGIGFGNEFAASREDGGWTDYMMKIEDPEKCDELLGLLSGEGMREENGMKFLSDSALVEQGSSLHDHYLDVIASTRQSLFIEMPFLGHPDYINAITEVVKRGVFTVVVVPGKAATHHYRNIHFLKRLVRQVDNADNLTISITPHMIHGKTLVSDGRMLFGSHNMNMDRSVLDEVVVEVGIPQLVEDMKRRIVENLESGDVFDNSKGLSSVFVQSRAEYASIKLQKFAAWVRNKRIRMARDEYQSFVGEMVANWTLEEERSTVRGVI